MSEKKSKEKMEENATQIFEVTIKTFSDNTVLVLPDDDRALYNPIIYAGRWTDKQEKMAKERQRSRILKPGDLN